MEVKIGSLIQFGEYNWRVLDVQGDKALIITEDVVEERKYHEKYVDITWEMCDLRKYLNSEFLDKFDKDKIILTDNKNPDNLWYGTKGGNDTQDKIFLLSLEEVDYYFGNSGDYTSMKRKKYDNGKFLPDNNGYCFSNTHDSNRLANFNDKACWWWLRSPGLYSFLAAYVYEDGIVFVSGLSVNRNRGGGVRPALWLKL